MPPNPKFQDVIVYVINIINDAIIPLLFALAVVFFVWGVVQYVINADDTEKKAKGRQFMIWGIIGLAVMMSVWGLVTIVGNTFGLRTNVLPQVRPNGTGLQPIPSSPSPSSRPSSSSPGPQLCPDGTYEYNCYN